MNHDLEKILGCKVEIAVDFAMFMNEGYATLMRISQDRRALLLELQTDVGFFGDGEKIKYMVAGTRHLGQDYAQLDDGEWHAADLITIPERHFSLKENVFDLSWKKDWGHGGTTTSLRILKNPPTN